MGLINIFGVSADLISLAAIDFGLIVDGAVITVEATCHSLFLLNKKSRLTQDEMNELVSKASKNKNLMLSIALEI